MLQRGTPWLHAHHRRDSICTHVRIQASQLPMSESAQFQQWSHQFELFLDDSGIWRCGGRLENILMSLVWQHPILLNRDHRWLWETVMRESCMEEWGVKATIRASVPILDCTGKASYWEYFTQLHHTYVVDFKGSHTHHHHVAPPLPSLRVKESTILFHRSWFCRPSLCASMEEQRKFGSVCTLAV